MKVLVTGGAGYVGSVLTGKLLEANHEVTVLDKLVFGGAPILSYFQNPLFHFIRGDVRNRRLVKSCLSTVDVVVHLAAIVGFPACSRDPELARSVNVGATRTLSDELSKDQAVIYASTGSNYGSLVGRICTEDTELKPLSLYGETKTEAEKILVQENGGIALRFATAFGVSPRLRLDLLINDLVCQAVRNRYIVMFEKDFKRTFIHVRDMASVIMFGLEHFTRLKGQIFNAGDDANNLSKEEIALEIKQYVEYHLHFADVGEDLDKRNYIVSYEKINTAGWKAQIKVDDGISELVQAMEAVDERSLYRNA